MGYDVTGVRVSIIPFSAAMRSNGVKPDHLLMGLRLSTRLLCSALIHFLSYNTFQLKIFQLRINTENI